MSLFLNARRETIKSFKNVYDFSLYCGLGTHTTLPLGETNLCFCAPSLVWPWILPMLWLWSRTGCEPSCHHMNSAALFGSSSLP